MLLSKLFVFVTVRHIGSDLSTRFDFDVVFKLLPNNNKVVTTAERRSFTSDLTIVSKSKRVVKSEST